MQTSNLNEGLNYRPPRIEYYKGNTHLLADGFKWSYSAEQLEEWLKCSVDPIYFIKNYMKIIHVDKGVIPFDLYDFQEQYVSGLHNNRHTIAKWPRQSGKSTTSIGYMLWYILFNEAKTVAILANKGATARVILSKLQLAYEHLPLWLQGGVKSWNKGSLELGNLCSVVAGSTTSSSIRGSSIAMLFIDEYAFIHPNQATEFFESVYPTISSGKETKIIMVSTPKGMNHFYKAWVEATEGRSDFTPFEINWWDVPGRDEAWKIKTIGDIGQESWDQEFEAQFIGSSNTLISGKALKELAYLEPIEKSEDNKLKIYAQPELKNSYVLVADCGEGVGADHTSFSVINISSFPYKQVATFRDNKTPVLLMPDIIVKVAKKYNDADVLIEINSSGNEIANLIRTDLDYENVLMVGQDKKHGQILMGGASNTQTPGLRTTKASKRTGCTTLKDLVENKKLEVVDFDTISELSTFIRKNNGTFSADELANDDTVMSLVVFGWMANQPYFESLKDTNLRQELHKQRIAQFEAEAMPMIFSLETEQKEQEIVIDSKGIHWHVADGIPWYDPYN